MASFLPENRECINGCDEFNTVEVLEIDGALLMSQLLDDSHVEDCDDERLTSVIQSLADEIKPIMMDGYDSFMELEWDNITVEDCGFSNGGQMDGQDCSTIASCDDLDYNWMDMEDMKSCLYLNPSQDGMEGVIEFGGVRDYYNYNYNYYNSYANSVEEHSYGSLWQDTNVLLM